MPYCWKCGAQLDEDAKYCPACGTPVGLVAERRIGREERGPLVTLAIVLIVLVVSAAIIGALGFSPTLLARTVERNWRSSFSRQTGLNTLILNLTADVAHINIGFEDLAGEWQSPLIVLEASAAAKVGAFVSPGFLERFKPVWHDATEGNVLTVTVKQEIDTVYFRWPPYESLNVTYNIRIDPSMNATLYIKVSTGGIVLDTQAGVVLNYLSLEATTGRIEANLVKNVVVRGDVSVRTTTGGVRFSWDNVIVTKDILVSAIIITGGVDVYVTQEKLTGNVTVRAEATTGGVNFAIDIHGDIGAKMDSTVATGGIDVDRQVGFSGTKSLLLSDNYPAESNFNVTLKTTTGGIDIDARYTT